MCLLEGIGGTWMQRNVSVFPPHCVFHVLYTVRSSSVCLM